MSVVRRALASVFAFVGFVVASVAAPAAAAASPPDWRPCDYAPGHQCANVTVPLDYSRPAGSTIQIALIRHLAADSGARGRTLVFNPGGPGDPGTVLLPLVYDRFPAEVRRQFAIVSFDPRGIGRSDGLRCFATEDAENAFLAQAAEGFPVGAAQTAAWERVWSGFDKQCAQHSGAVLQHMSTADATRDMDGLRAALDEPTLTYYGPSYGTLLGATYAEMFPSRVGAMVFDGNISPTAWAGGEGVDDTPTALRMAADTGTSATMNDFLALCGRATVQQCAFSAGNPAATVAKYQTLLQRLSLAPVSAGSPPQPYTMANTVAAVRNFLYTTHPDPALDQPGWAGGAQLLQELWQASATGSRTTVLSPVQPGGHTANTDPYIGIEQLLGVTCADSPNPRDFTDYATQADLAALRSGAFGPLWSWWSAGCAAWPGLNQDRYTGPWNRPTANTILVVGNTADPATDYSNSVAMAHDLARARLLTVAGYGHSALLNTSSCANGYITRYLLTGVLPPSGTVCTQDTAPFASQ